MIWITWSTSSNTCTVYTCSDSSTIHCHSNGIGYAYFLSPNSSYFWQFKESLVHKHYTFISIIQWISMEHFLWVAWHRTYILNFLLSSEDPLQCSRENYIWSIPIFSTAIAHVAAIACLAAVYMCCDTVVWTWVTFWVTFKEY